MSVFVGKNEEGNLIYFEIHLRDFIHDSFKPLKGGRFSCNPVEMSTSSPLRFLSSIGHHI